MNTVDASGEELKLRVLVVDDLVPARRVVRSLLKKLGIEEITEAESVATAESCLQTDKFDLIIADLNLKDGSGLELIKRLRTAEETRTLPAIIITSDADREQVMEGAELGVAGFLLKPFDKNMLREKIDEALNA